MKAKYILHILRYSNIEKTETETLTLMYYDKDSAKSEYKFYKDSEYCKSVDLYKCEFIIPLN